MPFIRIFIPGIPNISPTVSSDVIAAVRIPFSSGVSLRTSVTPCERASSLLENTSPFSLIHLLAPSTHVLLATVAALKATEASGPPIAHDSADSIPEAIPPATTFSLPINFDIDLSLSSAKSF